MCFHWILLRHQLKIILAFVISLITVTTVGIMIDEAMCLAVAETILVMARVV